MKVVYSSFVSGLAGQMDGTVYYRNQGKMFGYSRPYKYPTLTPQNATMGLNMKGIKGLWMTATALGKADFLTYAHKYSLLDNSGEDITERSASPFAVLVKAMWSIQRADPEHINLAMLTWPDVTTLGLVPFSIKYLVENGHLPAVEGWDLLDASMIQG